MNTTARSAIEISRTGVDDLYALQDCFDNIRAIFTLMLECFPEDSTPHSFAQLGIAETNDWSSKVVQWAECMDNEILSLETFREFTLPGHSPELRG